jgi:hypothetical protein
MEFRNALDRYLADYRSHRAAHDAVISRETPAGNRQSIHLLDRWLWRRPFAANS